MFSQGRRGNDEPAWWDNFRGANNSGFLSRTILRVCVRNVLEIKFSAKRVQTFHILEFEWKSVALRRHSRTKTCGEKWVHFFGPVNGKTKVDSFIGYAAHLGLIRGGTPSGLYC